MRRNKGIIALVVFVLIAWMGWADKINGVDMDFVSVENAGNTMNSDGYGRVDYNYRIGTTEVSIEQFQASGISPGNENGPDHWGVPDMPAVYINWHEAARFCNFLTTSNANLGAYTISAGLVIAVDRASAISTYGAIYVLPTEDEWYKAAYFTGSGYSLYANGTGTPPVSGVNAMFGTNTVWGVGAGLPAEQNGTFNMMGNVWEWQESAFDGNLDSIGEDIAFRGGGYNSAASALSAENRGGDIPGNTYDSIGFRVVSVPEPGTISLMSLSTLSLFFTRTLRRRKLAGKSLLPVGREHLCDTYCTVEEWDAAYNEIDDPDGLAIAGQLIQDKISECWVKAHAIYEMLDKKFWNRMVVVHERRVVRKKAFRSALKKKALGGFDAFLALILK